MKWQELRKEYPYLYETHLHTSQASACARYTGADMARAAKEYGYTGIIVTDHNWGGNTCIDRSLPWSEWIEAYCSGYRDAKNVGDKLGLDVFFGMEAGFNGTEFLLYGIDEEWLKANPAVGSAGVEELYCMMQKAGAMMIHAHPFREEYYIPEVRLFPEFIDGVEGINATHSNPKSTGHNNPSYDTQAIAYAAKYNFPLTAGSDIHTTELFGGGMAFKRRLSSIEDFVKAVLSGEDYILTNGDNCYTKYGEIL